MSVALNVGQSPRWVLKNFTLGQLLLTYKFISKSDFDFAELQARLVWAIANGWKRPAGIEDSADKLTKMGVMEEK
jgi:hypothetical protein